MKLNDIKKQIITLRNNKKDIEIKLVAELEQLENNNNLTYKEVERLEDQIYIKYNMDTLNSQLLKLEREYIAGYKGNLIKLGKYNNDIKYLFDKANINIIAHEKLINKLIGGYNK